jgi:ketosteroid isomerase-like protein
VNVAVDESPLCNRMIFLVGAMRSGTNWLQRMLAAHPDVASLPTETLLFEWLDQFSSHVRHAGPGSVSIGQVYMERSDYVAALRRLCDGIFAGNLAILGPADRLVERSPHHAHHLGLIGAIYPDASCVHIIRDGRDVVRSLINQSFGPDDAREAAAEWRASIEDARRGAPGLANYVEVRYEALLDDPRGEMTELYKALNLPASSDAIEAAVTEAGISFNADASSPELATGKWRTGLSPADVATVMEVAGATLADLGYETGPDTSAPAPAPTPARARRRDIAGKLKRNARAAVRAVRPDTAAPVEGLKAVLTANLDLVDRFLEALAAERADEVSELLAEHAQLRIVDGGATWERRGADAVEQFLQRFRGQVGEGARQTGGEVHPGIPSVTTIVDYDLGDGVEASRVIVVSVEGPRVTRVTSYCRHSSTRPTTPGASTAP